MRALAVIGSTADVLARFADPHRPLTPDERERAAAFRFDVDRDDFIAGHLLARICAAETTGLDPDRLTLVQRCPHCDGPHGPPAIAELPGWAVSLSHTRGYVAASIAQGATGVDVERLDRREPREIEQVALLAGEATFVRTAADPRRALLDLWVRKEALIKARTADLGHLQRIDLVRQGRVVDDWEDLRLTSWQDGRVIAACASTTAIAWRSLAGLDRTAGP